MVLFCLVHRMICKLLLSSQPLCSYRLGRLSQGNLQLKIWILRYLYLTGTLAISVQEEDRKLLVGFLEDVMTTLSLSHAPLSSLKASFVELGWDTHKTQTFHCVRRHEFTCRFKCYILFSVPIHPTMNCCWLFCGMGLSIPLLWSDVLPHGCLRYEHTDNVLKYLPVV